MGKKLKTKQREAGTGRQDAGSRGWAFVLFTITTEYCDLSGTQ